MKKLLLVASLLVLAALPLQGQDIAVGTVFQKVAGSITSPTARETAALVVGARIADGDWVARLVVTGADGRQIWASPLIRSLYNPQGYTIGNAGITNLDVAGDIDGDGRGEVVVEEPQSDVRPVRFRVLRWNGKGLMRVRSQSLMQQGAEGFMWTDRRDANAPWIHKFTAVIAPGRCRVETLDLQGNGGTAVVEATSRGYRRVH